MLLLLKFAPLPAFESRDRSNILRMWWIGRGEHAHCAVSAGSSDR